MKIWKKLLFSKFLIFGNILFKFKTNIFALLFRILTQVENQLVWRNPLPNSTLFARPVNMVTVKEDRETITSNFKPTIDAFSEMQRTPIECYIHGCPTRIWVCFILCPWLLFIQASKAWIIPNFYLFEPDSNEMFNAGRLAESQAIIFES